MSDQQIQSLIKFSGGTFHMAFQQNSRYIEPTKNFFAITAPEYRNVKSGMHISGTCEKCNILPIVNFGFGKFQINEILSSKCPECLFTRLKNIDNLGLLKCLCFILAKRQNQLESQLIAVSHSDTNNCYDFKNLENTNWLKLNFYVIKLQNVPQFYRVFFSVLNEFPDKSEAIIVKMLQNPGYEPELYIQLIKGPTDKAKSKKSWL